MGDRGNIAIKQNSGIEGEKPGMIYFYTHWRGSEIPIVLRDALKKGQGRWSDESYLGRIIFQELIGGDTDITGFGISSYLTDNEHPILVVDCETKTVEVLSRDGSMQRPAVLFSDYAGFTDAQAEHFGGGKG